MLTYGWEFYPQELISPGDFDGRESEIIYLGQYGGFEGSGGGSPHGSATYRLTVLLPDEENEYALELPEIYSSSRIWADGRLISSLGDVTDALSPPAIRTGMVTFQASGQTELVVQATDSRHYYSGMVYPPAFGSVDGVSDLISFRLLRTCVMVIASLTIGIMYLLIGLRIGSGRNKMTLFALVCLFFALHVMYPLFHLFGAGFWTYRLEDMSFYLFLTALTALHCHLCGITGRPKRIVLTISGLMILISLVVPSLLIGSSLDAMMIYSALLDAYKLLLFGWLIATALFNRNGTETISSLLLAGLCVMAVALLAQQAAPVFEPVRFGWQSENAGFILMLLLAGGLWFDTVNAYAERTALSVNMQLMKQQAALQEENYRIISSSFEEMQRMRHDLRHHFMVIGELTEQKQYDSLNDYVGGLKDSVSQSTRPVLCENHAAGAVLTYYEQQAVQRNIPLAIKVSLPASLKLESWVLGVLLGNLLENAFEASAKLPDEMRSVTVYSAISNGNLLVTVKNNWKHDFSSEENHIFSTKHEGFGIGLASVRSLVEKYGGQFYVSPEELEFEVSVVLWNVSC